MAPGLLSPWHIAILAVVLLLIFGPKRLPELGRSLGKGMREFRDSISSDEHSSQDEIAPPVAPTQSVAATQAPEHDTI